MTHILNNLPEEYDMVVEAMDTRLDDVVVQFTLGNVKNELNLKYKRIKKNKRVNEDDEDDEDDEEDQDTALVEYTKYFKGRCYSCRDFGHKKENFPKLRSQIKNNKSGRFDGTCFYCGKRGHIKSKCKNEKKT